VGRLASAKQTAVFADMTFFHLSSTFSDLYRYEHCTVFFSMQVVDAGCHKLPN
jgi:hypothetical protein